MSLILGYDIGGTKIAVCLARVSEGTDGLFECEIINKKRMPGGSKVGPKEGVEQMLALGSSILEESQIADGELTAIGLCAPGSLDTKKGVICASPNMKSWDQVPVVDELSQHFNCAVYLQNDANGAVLAESYFGSARGLTDIVYLSMSTGIGGGIISKGLLVEGAAGLGGELGHLVLDPSGPMCGCGLKGCFEAFCGGLSVARHLQEKASMNPGHPYWQLPGVDGQLENIDMRSLLAGVHISQPAAMEYWDEYCRRLAHGVGVCLMALNPQRVVLGTIAVHAGDELMNHLEKYLPQYAWRQSISHFDIAVSSLGTEIGELAGIATAVYALDKVVS